MQTSENIKKYYNGFSKDVQVADFRSFSPRQEAIKNLCSKFIPKSARILEVGCGVGIVTKHVQKRASFVLSFDISDSNAGVAALYAGKENTRFMALNILEDSEKLQQYAPFDAILIFDVIEHIQKDRHAELFSILERLLSDKGIILITYPGPEYQEYTKKFNPGALQIIDETIQVAEILKSTSLFPYYLAYKNIWQENQYIHLVLKRKIETGKNYKRDFKENLIYKGKKYGWLISKFFFRRKLKSTFKL